jgi:hypothetical protein
MLEILFSTFGGPCNFSVGPGGLIAPHLSTTKRIKPRTILTFAFRTVTHSPFLKSLICSFLPYILPVGLLRFVLVLA